MLHRYCLALDLINDPALIQQYVAHHHAVWPEVLQSHREAGVLRLEIYRTGDRLLMVMEVDEDFSFERKAALDAANPRVGEWEQLMARFQKPLSNARLGEKWVLMECVHRFNREEPQANVAVEDEPVAPGDSSSMQKKVMGR